mgnify:CR=1 FL=1
MLIGIDYPSKTISSTKAVMPTGDIEKGYARDKTVLQEL